MEKITKHRNSKERKAEWDRSKDLRDEFREFENYLAYMDDSGRFNVRLSSHSSKG